ncbi:fungal hydrophobin [Sanghuangporus baumii]|uniref:Hydrophobin n=1 Tax=Sanghuangporus baumii TaxID=108892 RepID=A0A9Q5HX16_SANBA|nr:fungal hydrophobin [Sanghuangporus baumii]
MFALSFKVATTILAIASAAVAVAIPAPVPGSGSCSTGQMQCCDSISPNNSTDDQSLTGLIAAGLQGTSVPIGVNCIPISAIGLGSAGTCSSQAACCDDVTSGLVGLNCSPVNVGL